MNGITIGGLNVVVVVVDCGGAAVGHCESEAEELGATVPSGIHAAVEAGALMVTNSVMVLGAAVTVLTNVVVA